MLLEPEHVESEDHRSSTCNADQFLPSRRGTSRLFSALSCCNVVVVDQLGNIGQVIKAYMHADVHGQDELLAAFINGGMFINVIYTSRTHRV